MIPRQRYTKRQREAALKYLETTPQPKILKLIMHYRTLDATNERLRRELGDLRERLEKAEAFIESLSKRGDGKPVTDYQINVATSVGNGHLLTTLWSRRIWQNVAKMAKEALADIRGEGEAKS